MMKWLAGLISVAFVGSGWPGPARAACPLDAGVVMKGPTDTTLKVMLKTRPVRVPVSVPFRADVTICGSPDRVTLDATMPRHRHGMNYVPKTTKVTDGRFHVEGLLFHMPGRWRFEVTAYQHGKPVRFVHDVDVE